MRHLVLRALKPRTCPGLRRILLGVILLTGCGSSTGSSPADDPAQLPRIAAKTRGLRKLEGLLPLYPDPARGRLWLELPVPDRRGHLGEFLYVEGLVSGLGSNPVGLDRGQLGDTQVVRLRRLGPRVLVEVRNLRYRALSDEAAERTAVEESFATSVLWAAEIAAVDPDGRSLVDFTSFVLRDAHGVVARLKERGQGEFALDGARSAIDFEQCLVFPDNLELEGLLTYAGKEPGLLVRETAPVGEAVTLRQHHSLLHLPDAGYRPRRFDPRAGSFAVVFADYAAPLDEPVHKRWIVRHRLERVDSTGTSSKVKEPVVYYVDRGAPEPIRSALLEGASWWAEAFERAGFEDGYRVELLPEDAHPLDARYNVIQWVHRSTRGWSYGGGVVDPRTGEMIKGHVSLGSLRVRQDRLLFEGLAGTEKTGTGTPDDPVELALARIRQLAAHEVGHTLGLTHNFVASTYGDRASVMDYPAPRIGIDDENRLDFSGAYGVGVGAWDRYAIDYAYREFPPGTDEDDALDAIVRQGIEDGLRFIADHDARPARAAHPAASLWDDGADPVAAFEHALRVRRIALGSFGERNVRTGAPLATLGEVFTPVYLHHRFQLRAVVKLLGGLEFVYAVRGDGQPAARPVAAERQRDALRAALRALDPAELDIPEPVLALLMPRPFGYEGRNREIFPAATAPAFDALGATATAADLVVQNLLQPQRCARLVDFHRRDAAMPGLEEVLDALLETVFAAGTAPPRREEIRYVVQRVVVDRMIDLAAQEDTPAPVRARVEGRLAALRERLAVEAGDTVLAVHAAALGRDIERYLEDRQWRGPEGWRPAPPPPGEPIGSSNASPLGCSWMRSEALDRP